MDLSEFIWFYLNLSDFISIYLNFLGFLSEKKGHVKKCWDNTILRSPGWDQYHIGYSKKDQKLKMTH